MYTCVFDGIQHIKLVNVTKKHMLICELNKRQNFFLSPIDTRGNPRGRFYAIIDSSSAGIKGINGKLYASEYVAGCEPIEVNKVEIELLNAAIKKCALSAAKDYNKNLESVLFFVNFCHR